MIQSKIMQLNPPFDAPIDNIILLALHIAPKAYYPVLSPATYEESFPLLHEEVLGDTQFYWPKHGEWPTTNQRISLAYVGSWRDPRFTERPLVQLFISDPRNWLVSPTPPIITQIQTTGLINVVYDGCVVDSVYRHILPTDDKIVFFNPYDINGVHREDPSDRMLIREWQTRPEVCYQLLLECSKLQELLLSDYLREKKTQDRMRIIDKYNLGVSKEFKVGGHVCGTNACSSCLSKKNSIRSIGYVACNVLNHLTKQNNMLMSVLDDGTAITRHSS